MSAHPNFFRFVLLYNFDSILIYLFIFLILIIVLFFKLSQHYFITNKQICQLKRTKIKRGFPPFSIVIVVTIIKVHKISIIILIVVIIAIIIIVTIINLWLIVVIERDFLSLTSSSSVLTCISFSN